MFGFLLKLLNYHGFMCGKITVVYCTNIFFQVIYTDVALDPYSSDGHDGIVREDGKSKYLYLNGIAPVEALYKIIFT